MNLKTFSISHRSKLDSETTILSISTLNASKLKCRNLYFVIMILNSIELINCLDGMKHLPENSVDMVCTDPPYFLDGLGNDWDKNKIDKKGASSVVGNLPKGMKFDRKQSKKFHDFYSDVSKEVFRVLKPGGAFISFSSPRLYHSMAMAVEENGFEIRDMMAWVYTQSQVKAFSQNHIIEKDKIKTREEKDNLKQLKPAIEPMCLAVKPIEGRYIDNFEKYGTGLLNTSEETKVDDKFPSNVMTVEEGVLDKVFLVKKPSKTEKGDFNTHLSVKPVELVQHLIQLFTKKDAIVLDPFMGSGTTAIAAVNCGRNYMGFDINNEYIEISNKRLLSLLKE
jgi:site-specific DNA-methyltransferase (adenine-specific)